MIKLPFHYVSEINVYLLANPHLAHVSQEAEYDAKNASLVRDNEGTVGFRPLSPKVLQEAEYDTKNASLVRDNEGTVGFRPLSLKVKSLPFTAKELTWMKVGLEQACFHLCNSRHIMCESR